MQKEHIPQGSMPFALKRNFKGMYRLTGVITNDGIIMGTRLIRWDQFTEQPIVVEMPKQRVEQNVEMVKN